MSDKDMQAKLKELSDRESRLESELAAVKVEAVEVARELRRRQAVPPVPPPGYRPASSPPASSCEVEVLLEGWEQAKADSAYMYRRVAWYSVASWAASNPWRSPALRYPVVEVETGRDNGYPAIAGTVVCWKPITPDWLPTPVRPGAPVGYRSAVSDPPPDSRYAEVLLKGWDTADDRTAGKFKRIAYLDGASYEGRQWRHPASYGGPGVGMVNLRLAGEVEYWKSITADWRPPKSPESPEPPEPAEPKLDHLTETERLESSQLRWFSGPSETASAIGHRIRAFDRLVDPDKAVVPPAEARNNYPYVADVKYMDQTHRQSVVLRLRQHWCRNGDGKRLQGDVVRLWDPMRLLR